MTTDALSQIYYLKQEIKMNRRRIQELKDEARHTPARLRPIVADTCSIIEERQRRSIAELESLEQYIADIQDDLTRQIFTYRFEYGLTWMQVSERLGGFNSDANVRMIAYRYLKKH